MDLIQYLRMNLNNRKLRRNGKTMEWSSKCFEKKKKTLPTTYFRVIQPHIYRMSTICLTQKSAQKKYAKQQTWSPFHYRVYSFEFTVQQALD